MTSMRSVTPQTNATLARISSELRERNDFVLCGHVSPDGDCVGSQLALSHTLKALGKNVVCLAAEEAPADPSLAFLPGYDALVPAACFAGAARTFVALDVPTRARIGEAAAALLDSCDFSITVDHHASDAIMTELAYIEPGSASCTMLVWELCRLLLDVPPTTSALCAYTGLVTDTGGFQFQNTDRRAFEIAADMVACGADPSLVARNVLQNRSRASLALEARALSRMRFCAQGTCVVSWVTRSDMDELGAAKPDVEPLVNALRSLRGIEVAVMLREQGGEVRGSARAKAAADVASFARFFGGGGHVAAAGFTVRAPLDEAIARIELELERRFGAGATEAGEGVRP